MLHIGLRGLAAYLFFAIALPGLIIPAPVEAQAKKPNILVIRGDDIGQSNISAYTMGLVGYPVGGRAGQNRT